ncbi:MAG TPA: hypothetical protein VIJ00_11945 [Nakamurella sp.]
MSPRTTRPVGQRMTHEIRRPGATAVVSFARRTSTAMSRSSQGICSIGVAPTVTLTWYMGITFA